MFCIDFLILSSIIFFILFVCSHNPSSNQANPQWATRETYTPPGFEEERPQRDIDAVVVVVVVVVVVGITACRQP